MPPPPTHTRTWPRYPTQIAQQLSTRVDLVPEAYLSEFRRLQDNVKTFSTVEARAVLEEGEWQCRSASVSETFSTQTFTCQQG